MFYRFARALVGFLFRLWYHIDYRYDCDVSQYRGFILAGNHQSNIDPILVAVGLRQQVHFMAKAELFRIPVLGAAVRKLGAFPVERGKGDTTAIETAIATIDAGEVLGIFPEGTRSMDGKLLRPKSGCVLIAAKTGAGILPVGTTFCKGRRFRSTIIVHYGTPISAEELALSRDEIKHKELKTASYLIMDRISALMEENEKSR